MRTPVTCFTKDLNPKICTMEPALTHWGRVTHISVSKLTTIGSDNGLSPGRRQTIIWTNAGILLVWSLGTNFSEILIGIQTFSFKKNALEDVVCKTAAILSQPQCVKQLMNYTVSQGRYQLKGLVQDCSIYIASALEILLSFQYTVHLQYKDKTVSQCLTLNIFKDCHLDYMYLNLQIYSSIEICHSHIIQWYETLRSFNSHVGFNILKSHSPDELFTALAIGLLLKAIHWSHDHLKQLYSIIMGFTKSTKTVFILDRA